VKVGVLLGELAALLFAEVPLLLNLEKLPQHTRIHWAFHTPFTNLGSVRLSERLAAPRKIEEFVWKQQLHTQ